MNKALGPDQLSGGAIQLLWKWDIRRNVRLKQVAIQMGSHPAVQMRAGGVVIGTPFKDNYKERKDYCFLSMLSCMGNAVKTVVTELLSDDAKKRGL